MFTENTQWVRNHILELGELAWETYIEEYAQRPSCRELAVNGNPGEWEVAMETKIMACYKRTCDRLGYEPRTNQG